jgi:hypothetical protein
MSESFSARFLRALALGGFALFMAISGLAVVVALRPAETSAQSGDIYACYNRSTFDLRYTSDPDNCTRTERELLLTYFDHPYWFCTVPSTGVIRFSGTQQPSPNRCGAGAASFQVPRASETTLCVKNSNGAISAGPCGSGYTPLVIPAQNRAPDSLNLSGSTVSENASNGTAIGAFSGTDPDGDSLTFSLTNDAGGRFAVSGNQLVVADGSRLNYENATSHDITVKASDPSNASISRTFTITVTDVNDAPSVSDDSFSVSEDAGTGTFVGTVEAFDQDAGQSLDFSFQSGNTGGAFSIDNNTGEIFVANDLNYETRSGYTLVVLVEDNGSPQLSSTATITVSILDANEAPSAQDDSFSIAESAADGASVGTVQVNDPDNGQSFDFSFQSGNTGAAFSIDSGTGEITVANPLDYETRGSYTLIVLVEDSGSPTLSDTATITVTVTDVNEAPTEIALTSTSIGENVSAPAVVGTLSATDPDAGETFSYALVSGTGDDDNSRFSITGDQLRAEATFDYETETTLSIRVQVTDGGGNTFAQSFTITVTDLNDAPTAIALMPTSVNEVLEGAPVGTTFTGTLSTTDPDLGDAFTYALVTGTGDTDNALFAISGNQLTSTEPFDYESKSSYSVRVKSTDSGGLFVEQALTITVTDVNDPPTITGGLAEVTIDTGAENGDQVGPELSPDDPDTGQTHTWAIEVNDAPTTLLAIADGIITVADADQLAVGDLTVTVAVTDSGTPPATAQISFTLHVEPMELTADEYDAVGNTKLAVGVTVTGEAVLSVTGNLLDNDNLTGTWTASLKTPNPGGNGRIVTIEDDGTFTYVPAVGFTGDDRFEYSATDGSRSGVGEVTVHVDKKVWYVKNNAASGGTGRSNAPFQTIAAANIASGEGDTIYIFYGNGSAYTDLAVLKSGQRLLGEGVDLMVDEDTLYTGSGNRSRISPSATSAVQILANSGSPTDKLGVEVRGLTLSTASAALSVQANDGYDVSYSLSDNTISSSAAYGVYTTSQGSSSATADIHGNTISGAGYGIQLSGFGSTLTVTNFADNTVTAGGITASGVIFDADPGGDADTVAGGATSVTGSTLAFAASYSSGAIAFDDLDLVATAGRGLYLNNSAGLTFSVAPDVATIAATGGPALDLSDVTVDLRLVSLTSTGGTFGVSVVNTNGTVSAGAGSSIVTTAANSAFNVNGGSANVTYRGTISADLGYAVRVQNKTGGSVAFTGAITDGGDGDGNGISLVSNSASAPITFSGGITLSTGTNTAFAASGTNTVNVCAKTLCGSGSPVANTLTTTTGIALQFSTGAGIGAEGLTFRSITSTGGGAGYAISLTNTGSAGGLTVTGDGTSTAGGNGSGGTITRANSGAATGIGITGVQSTVLQNMTVNGDVSFVDSDQATIKSTTVIRNTIGISYQSGSTATTPSLTLDAVLVSGGSPVSPISLEKTGGQFTLSITGSTFDGAIIRLQSTSDAATSVTASSSTFKNVVFGFQIAHGGGALSLQADDNEFTNTSSAGIYVNQNGGTTAAVISDNTFASTGGSGVYLNLLGAATSRSVTISGNKIDGGTTGIFLGTGGTGVSIDNDFAIENNDIGESTPPSSAGMQINMSASTAGYTVDTTLSVKGNTIAVASGGYGVYAETSATTTSTSTSRSVIIGNQVTGGTIDVFVNGSASGCYDLNADNSLANANSTTSGYRVTASSGVLTIDGMTPGSHTATEVQTFLSARNTGTPINVIGTITGGTC